jgi:hypothetical protein
MTDESSEQPGRLPRIDSGVGLALAFLTIFLGADAIAALTYPAQAAEMPLLVGGLGAILSLVQLVKELRKSREPSRKARQLAGGLRIYAWVWGFVAAIVLFGFLQAAPPMLFAYLRWQSREPVWLAAVFAASGLALLYGIFVVLLGVPVFEGLVTPVVIDWLSPA